LSRPSNASPARFDVRIDPLLVLDPANKTTP